MRAIICTSYGTPDVLQLRQVAKPVPADHEVLIKVYAATVGPSDCAFRKGEPFIVKLIYGLSKPRLKTQGVEFAGQVEAIGGAVTDFAPGDQVFGISPNTFGAHADYLCLPASKPLVVKSARMSYEDAAAICDGAPTALTFLRDKARIQPGQQVLVNGASGAVGAYAVQLAKHFGAEVTGVCSAANLGLVTSLGADHVIDYAQTDFAANGRRYDIIFDAVGKSSFSRCQGALKPRGVYLSTVPAAGLMLQMARTALFAKQRAMFAAAGLMQTKANLAFLRDLFEAGALRPVIDRRYPLEQVPEAHGYVDTERKKGNVVIVVHSDPGI